MPDFVYNYPQHLGNREPSGSRKEADRGYRTTFVPDLLMREMSEGDHQVAWGAFGVYPVHFDTDHRRLRRLTKILDKILRRNPYDIDIRIGGLALPERMVRMKQEQTGQKFVNETVAYYQGKGLPVRVRVVLETGGQPWEFTSDKPPKPYHPRRRSNVVRAHVCFGGEGGSGGTPGIHASEGRISMKTRREIRRLTREVFRRHPNIPGADKVKVMFHYLDRPSREACINPETSTFKIRTPEGIAPEVRQAAATDLMETTRKYWEQKDIGGNSVYVVFKGLDEVWSGVGAPRGSMGETP